MTTTFSHGYALLIGVGQALYPRWSLPVTVRDVQALKRVLVDPNLCAYPDDADHIRLLRDDGATRSAILDGLAWLKDRAAADKDATAVVYFSGHGWLAHDQKRYYLIPHDVEPFDIPHSALPAEAFTAGLDAIPARRLLVFVDSCHAAGMAKDAPPVKLPPGMAKAALPEDLAEILAQGEGRAIFASSKGEERSWIRPDGTLSLYTHHVLEALQGAGNQPGDSEVTVSAIMRHLSRSVPQSAQALGHTQTPFYKLASEDFPIALLLGGKGLPGGGWNAVAEEAAATTERIVQEAIVIGNGAISQGGGSAIGAGGVQTGGNVRGDVVTGTKITHH